MFTIIFGILGALVIWKCLQGAATYIFIKRLGK